MYMVNTQTTVFLHTACPTSPVRPHKVDFQFPVCVQVNFSKLYPTVLVVIIQRHIISRNRHALYVLMSEFDTSPHSLLFELERCLCKCSKLPLLLCLFHRLLESSEPRHPPEEKLSTLPPCKPKAEEIYI